MTQRNTWAAMDSSIAEKYGGSWLRPQSAAPEAAGDMSSLNHVRPATGSSPLSAHSGLVGVGVLAAVSIGLMAFATTVRVGHAEAHVGVGKV